MIKKTFVVLFVLSLTPTVFAKTPLKTAIQIATTASEGKYSIEETTQIAAACGLDAVVFTDRDHLRWEYGLRPLENILKKTVEQGSIANYGIKKYLGAIETAQKKHPNMLLMPGTESAPYYCWKGIPFTKSFAMYDWHKHLLAIGMDKSDDYQNLPVIGNTCALRKTLNIFLMWPLLGIIAISLIIALRRYAYTDEQGHPLGKTPRYLFLLLLIAIFFSVNNYPFRNILFNPYDGKNAHTAYQNYIDYVKSRGGLVFWAHPEATNTQIYQGIYFETKAHYNELPAYHGYTGYCIFYEGYEALGCPGGLWDEMLTDFCQGKRKDPVWVIGGCAIEKGDYTAAFRDLHTGVFCQNDRKDFLRALSRGEMYVARGSYSLDFTLNEFFLAKNTLTIKGNFKRGKNLSIILIEYGKMTGSYEVGPDFDLKIPVASHREKSYYRLEIKSAGLHVVTNPVFTE